MSNLLVFPKFKKSNVTEMETLHDVEELANHYTIQVMSGLQNHGVKPDPVYMKDMYFLQEVMKAIMLRTQGKYHSLQEWMDDAYIDEMEEEEE